jgi:phosphoglycolate phosphatase
MTYKHTEKRVVLFDVDGTLLHGGDTHWNAFKNAFKKTLNIDIKPIIRDKYQGFTDTGIIYDLMKENDVVKDASTTQKIMNAMIGEFENATLSDAILIDGVEDVLKALSKHENIVIGLVTGNLESIAYTKLKRFNIREYFLLGGFGHVSDVRSELILNAIDQTEKKFGAISKNNVFIIGDTHRDILAAQEAGVKVIAVATGSIPLENLKSYNPTYAFENLKDTKKVLEVIQHG